MPLHPCNICDASTPWNWEDAFLVYGFADGANSETDAVAHVLKKHGYEVDQTDGIDENPIICAITKNDKDLIAEHKFQGATPPREILPAKIIALLDAAFPPPPPGAAFRVPLPFRIDEAQCSDTTLHVTLKDSCSITITRASDGVKVLLLPAYPSAHPEVAAFFPTGDLKPAIPPEVVS